MKNDLSMILKHAKFLTHFNQKQKVLSLSCGELCTAIKMNCPQGTEYNFPSRGFTYDFMYLKKV